MKAGTIRQGMGYHGGDGCEVGQDTIGDSGGASRFYPQFAFEADPFVFAAKASTIERELGCEHLPAVSREQITGRKAGSAGTKHAGSSIRRKGEIHNSHPTPKPIGFLRWLIRLGTPHRNIIERPPVVLDFACGSGSTGCAALLEGCSFIGCDIDPVSIRIAEARIRWWESHPEGPTEQALAQSILELSGQLSIAGGS